MARAWRIASEGAQYHIYHVSENMDIGITNDDHKLFLAASAQMVSKLI